MRSVASCGTLSGVARHRRTGEVVCEACKAAYAAYARELRRRRKAGLPISTQSSRRMVTIRDDAGRPICRWCHTPTRKAVVGAGRYQMYCSERCRNQITHERYIGGRQCKCGATKDPGRQRCTDCARSYSEDGRFRKHGTTRSAMVTVLDEQGGLCAICPREIALDEAQIDHDHACCPKEGSCGACIRGLLCFPCNAGLGQFEDSTARLMSAVEYLQRNRRCA